MNSRLIIAALVTLIVFSSLLSTVAPEVGAEKVDAHEFVSLEAYGVDREYILKALGSYPNAFAQLRSLVLQASANNLTPAQVQTVFREILNPPASVSQGVYGQLSEDGMYFKLPSGRTVPNRHAHITLKSQFANTDAAGVGVSAFSSTFRNVVDPSDQSGVYWLVQSRTGYDQATAFINLPHITVSPTSPDRPYMYFAVNNSTGSVVGDYGIVFFPASGWHLFSNTFVWNSVRNAYDKNWWQSPTPLPSQYTGGSSLYLHIQIANTTSTDSVTINLRDGNTFAALGSRTVGFTANPFNATLSNVNIFRQITIAQHLGPGGTLNTNTGTHMANARFSNAFLYSPSGYWLWGINQTNDVYRKAPTTAQLATVTVNSLINWSAENITIRFNVP